MDPDSVQVIVNGVLVAGGVVLTWMTGIIVYIVRKETGRASIRDPRAVLEARYAAGEIDEDQFRHRLSVLTYGPPLPTDLPVPEEDFIALKPSEKD